MKIKLVPSEIAALAVFAATISAAPDPNFHIYLGFGQSTSDRLHFNSEGSRKFGKRYGEKMLSLLHPPAAAEAK